ncbi:hypothetical protein BDY21DRAFT_386618 [Lineolata rhizophorae]|uniref:Radical SAM core domain-containing protein n=1 Tax=Lineolata rhizophorae TaxID=578093 RepID=A0A6A6NX74_9PEZI|nr:hypothetical protein BDY21DRAFT_386618 [Lineolata rhizophorae]
MLPLEEVQRGLRMLRAAGMRKANFAGGEPSLYKPYLGALTRYCKEELGLDSVTIITNGSLIDVEWMQEYAAYVDVVVVSCDSFDEETNVAIGRGSGGNVAQLAEIARLCDEFGVKFQLNTVVCALNWCEDMAAKVAALAPFRWKAFLVLVVKDEKDGESPATLRDVGKFHISNMQFNIFCDRHKHLDCFVPESNEAMARTHLLLDESMRILDKRKGRITRSESLLDVGVEKAMRQAVWD